jgi:hypothetical protein
MKKLGIISNVCVLLMVTSLAYARGGGHSGGHAGGYSAFGQHTSRYCATCARDSQGHIQRDPQTKQEFMNQTGYPHGRPGYVVDHIVPLYKGGCDCPANMPWQTIEAAKAKDQWE